VCVKYFAALREIVGKREEIIEIDRDTTVETLLLSLSEKYGDKFNKYVFKTQTTNPKENLQFLIDGKSITAFDGIRTKLNDDCKFVIIPPVGGGTKIV
jgi:MoaD family protein